ncbi:MAG: sigma-54 dependent transcriptional regulator [Gemmatimonadota bacterium]|nr:sigma-54 dependent transcriptional regulator [Gemmatimonadota bacterium]MDQ8171095.1 sigma-54 dependent transcriptional regulator [Gemmatimonadota bacterium]
MSVPPFRAVDPGSPIRVLIAEDEANLGMILEQFMSARGFAVTMVRDGRAALEALRSGAFDVALLDVVMPELDGLEVLRLVREAAMPPEIIVITGNGTVETAIAALKLGAYDFLSKPYRMAEIEVIVKRAWEKRMLTCDNHTLQARLRRVSGVAPFLTQYAPLRAVLTVVGRVAAEATTVLITGEVGTGKRHIARLLHTGGAEPEASFIDVNCALLPAESSEADLFGVERDPVGAEPPRTGLLELAAGGTLYLHNVGALELRLQALLLHALESGSFCRVGGTQPVPVRARLVAADAADLDRMVHDGQFLAGLLHQLSAIRITVPALRDRAVDITLLAAHFLDAFGAARGKQALVLSPEAAVVLEQYPWPGNVRELQTVMERAALLVAEQVVGPAGLAMAVATTPDAARDVASGLTLVEVERRHMAAVLQQTGWHQGRAADLLGISPKTLYRKIREYGFQRPAGGARA